MSVITVSKNEKSTGLSVKTQTLATFVAVVAAVVLPQLLHVGGKMAGVGSSLGETLLPMHLPIILVGLFAGPYAGAVAGLLAPICSSVLSGMPVASMLPLIAVELFTYGLCSGVLKNVTLPTIAKVLFVQIGGRVARALATFTIIYIIGSSQIEVASIWMSIYTGIWGIFLQLLIIPVVVKGVERVSKNEA